MPHENVKVEMSGWTERSKGEAGDPSTSSVFKLLVRRLVCLWFLVMFMTFYSILLSSVSFSIVYTATYCFFINSSLDSIELLLALGNSS